jgi:hypothetical protein
MLQIRSVESKADWKAFLDLPSQIYNGDALWVPPLRIAVKDSLDVNKNPFFKHAFMHPVLAWKGDQCVGRVVGVIDENHNKFHEEKTAFFGFFECIDDQAVANGLLDAVLQWAQSKNMKTVRGPVSLSTNHECGLLIEGFDASPSVMMTYNPKYYEKLLEKWGLAKSKDLFAYEIPSDINKFSERLLAHSERLKQRSSVVFRSIKMNQFSQEIDRIISVYNDAWEKNWGFVPMDEEEFKHMAKDMKAVVDPELILIAEVRGEVAGFSLALPDVNQAFKKLKDGKLSPIGLVRLIWNLKGPGKKKTINRLRILTLGIKQNYRSLALGPLFYTEYFKRANRLGYAVGECSWILEDNVAMNKALKLMSATKTKTYRIYDRSI